MAKTLTYGCEKLDSKALKSAFFEVDTSKRTGRLLITFHTDNTYEYLDVPEFVFLGLLYAESYGKYFQAHIKDKY